MARAVVTGAAGRLGGKIARALRKTGYYVVGIDRSPSLAEIGVVDEYIQCDLAHAPTGAPVLDAALEGARAVVHCAAWPGPSATPPPAVLAAGEGSDAAERIGLEATPPSSLLMDNVTMTTLLCDAAVKAGVERFVFSSSAFAMGWSHAPRGPRSLRPMALPLDESAEPCPFESYGLSKLLCEQVLECAARTACGTAFVSLRFTNIIKAERWAELPWPAPTAERCLPLVFWAYTHEDDVVHAHVEAVQSPLAAAPGSHEAYLIAAPDTRFDVPTAGLLQTVLGLSDVTFAQPMEGNRSPLSCRKARARLGFSPRSWQESRAPGASHALPQGEVRGGMAAVAARRDAALAYHPLQGFRLESGEELCDGAMIGYKVHGDLSRAPGGVILHPTSFDAVHTELEYNIGPGKTLDTSRYAVVVVNMLGNGVSFSPSTAPRAMQRGEFPQLITMGDNVRAQAMVLDALGVGSLTLVYGYSMGAAQAYEWAVRFPDRVEAIAAVCGAARCAPINTSFLLSLEASLQADRRWRPKERCFDNVPVDGLRAFGRIYSGWGVGQGWYEKELFRTVNGYASAEDFVHESYEAGFARSDADDMLSMIRTWKSADVSRNAEGDFGAALARIRAKVLLMPCSSDRYFTVQASEAEAALLGDRAVLKTIASDAGHRAGDPHRPELVAESDFIRASVAELLAARDPARSEGT